MRNDTSNGSKIDNKGSQKVEREIKKQERLAQDAVEGQEEFNAAVQAINNQSFVLEANNIQPMNGQVFYVNSNTNSYLE